MSLTAYQAKLIAHELTKRSSPDSVERLTGALASARVDLSPHQVDAALFAFASPLSSGGFRYCRLAPSLLAKDKWGNWVVSPEFYGAMLAEAACRVEGFACAPSDTIYWQHGRSTERDFIYVTPQHLGHDDYSLKVENLPKAPPPKGQQSLFGEGASK